jgi:transposase
MFSLNSTNNYYLYHQATDMRKSFEGLSGIIQSTMKHNPLSGDVYLFINKQKDKIKLLRWEYGGFVLYYKRLEQGSLSVPKRVQNGASEKISWPELVLMIEGIVVEKYRQKPRFSTLSERQNNLQKSL